MIYAIQRADGGVSVMRTYPVKVIIGKRVQRVIRREETYLFLQDGETKIDTGVPVKEMHNLKLDSVSGVTLVFPNPETEIEKSELRSDAVRHVEIDEKGLPDRAERGWWKLRDKRVVGSERRR